MRCARHWLVVLSALSCLAGVGLPRAARAQEPAPEGAEGAVQPQPAPRPSPAPTRSGGGNIIRLEEEVIEGRYQKPEAFYILQRSNLDYEALELKKSFLPNIVESVKKAPF